MLTGFFPASAYIIFFFCILVIYANSNIVVKNYGTLFNVDSQSLLNVKKDGSDVGGLSHNVTYKASSSGVPSKGHEKMNSSGEQSEGVSGKMHGETHSINSRGQPASSTSSSSDSVGGAPVFSGPGLSPSSSMCSLSSEKSTLNPHAKV